MPRWVKRFTKIGRRTTRHSDPLTLLASMANALDEAVVGLTAGGMVVLWNAGAETMTGRTATEVLGSPASDFVPRDHRKELDTLIQQAVRTGRSVLWYGSLLAKGGDPVPAWVTLCPVWDEFERVRGAVMVVRQPRGARPALGGSSPVAFARAGDMARVPGQSSDEDLSVALDQIFRDLAPDAPGSPVADPFPLDGPGRSQWHPAAEAGDLFRTWSGFRGFFLN